MKEKKMRDLRNIKIAKPDNWKTFEFLCKSLWEQNEEIDFIKLYGRQGQAQSGIDLYGYKTNGDFFAIQCKDVQLLTTKIIDNEIALALNSKHEIKHYILCTTLNRDTKLQDYEILINKNLKFKFDILFWEDIEEMLKEEKNYNIFHRFYNQLIANNETLGHGIGKLINLELGMDSKFDTHYELMIGKIPKDKDDDYNNVSYYKGSYFIMNFHEKKFDIFNLPCFPLDIDMAFSNDFDRFRIAEWITSINNLDDFIYDKKDNINYSITKEKALKRIEDTENDNT